MAMLVAYESGLGRARRAADAVADAAAGRGVATLVRAIDEVDPEYIAGSEAVIVGCWTPGKVPFGDQPTRRMCRWIDGLPELDGKTIGVYCTYRFFPRSFADTATRTAETLHELSSRFELKGGTVAATRSINYWAIDEAAADLVRRTLGHVS
jgi:flavodoxin